MATLITKSQHHLFRSAINLPHHHFPTFVFSTSQYQQQQKQQMSSHTKADWAELPDWTKLPAPVDDGAAAHLQGLAIPADLALPATDGPPVALGRLVGRTVVFAYPRSGTPLVPLADWDAIPGARGCTPHACAFRDRVEEFKKLGVAHLFGLSTQDTGYQRELATNAHLPFPLLSDQLLGLTKALRLPTMEVGGETMIKRLALVLDSGVVSKVFYPVFPPDQNAPDVLEWLQQQQKQCQK